MRYKIGKKDDIPTLKWKLAGQRDAKHRWRYNREGKCANLAIGVLDLLEHMQPEVERDMVYREK